MTITPEPDRFSASVASRHMACPGSANLPLSIPNWTPPVVDPTAGAKGVGTTLHAALEPLMRTSSQQQFRWLAQAVAYVAELRERRRFQCYVEHHMQATWLATEPWTTADLVLFTKDELHIIDFKFGKIPVEVVGNKQLLFYAATYAELAPKAKEVHLHVVQPPAGQFDVWVPDAAEIASFMIQAKTAELRIQSGDTTLVPNDGCIWCPAYPHARVDKGKPLCPSAMRLLYPPLLDEQAMLAD